MERCEPLPQLLGAGEVVEFGGGVGDEVELYELMTVGRVCEGDVESLGLGFGVLESVGGAVGFVFGLDEGEVQAVGVPEDIVGAFRLAALRVLADEVDAAAGELVLPVEEVLALDAIFAQPAAMSFGSTSLALVSASFSIVVLWALEVLAQGAVLKLLPAQKDSRTETACPA